MHSCVFGARRWPSALPRWRGFTRCVKPSLCRAGVLPWLANHDGWSCVEVVPGRHPVRALAAALAPWTSSDEAVLADLLRDSPDAVAREIRRRIVAEARPATASPAPPRRLLLFVD